MLAWDLDRNDWRIFRVDRISTRPPTGVTFQPRARTDPTRDVVEYVTKRLTTTGDTYHSKVSIHAPAATIAAKTPYPIPIESIDDSTSVIEIEIDSGDPMRLALWLVQLNTDFEIIEGDELTLALNKTPPRHKCSSSTNFNRPGRYMSQTVAGNTRHSTPRRRYAGLDRLNDDVTPKVPGQVQPSHQRALEFELKQ